MKNLSSIPCLSLFEAFTILITLAVCLAGFTEAEVHSNLRKHVEDSYATNEGQIGEDVPYSQKMAKLRGGELQATDLENLNNYRVGSLEKLIKRQSDDFGESADSEGEKESDGYGYDDDEYYHFNYKRNDDAVGNAESSKVNKEGVDESNTKEGILSSQKLSTGKSQKENEKEMQTIEMLNFKEFHPNIGNGENPTQNSDQNQKPFSYENAHRKLPSSSVESLNMRDLKENSAIDEKMKDRKDESGGILAGSSTDSKVTENKKGIKTTEEKDGAKLKDAKLAEGPEKKEKEASLKDIKENVATKNLKDNAKSSEEKDKNLKLNENAKLEENLEKMNAKNKESETAKITKEDKDSSKLTAKANVDVINPNDISQISNRANFVSSDYKDSMEAMNPTAVEDDEKNSDESNENEKNVGVSEYEDLRERGEKQGERELSLRGNDLGNDQEGVGGGKQDAVKASDYLSFPLTFEMKGNGQNDYFKKRESWKDHGKFHLQQDQMQQLQDQVQQQQQQQQQQQIPQDQNTFEHDVKNLYHLKFPPGELENTEYHKNFIKSLRRYKGLSDNAKVLTPESTSLSSAEKSSFQEKQEGRKKKRSKTKKRRSSVMSGDKDTAEGGHPKSRRNDFGSADRSQWYPTQQRIDSQESKTGEENSKVSESKKYNEQQENPRQRRKSPAKLEYEIKIINHNQQESKNVPFSALRMKKDVKTKLATDDKYLKKYPYSQVSRDDLTRLREPDRKYKRKAPAWMRKDQGKEALIQTRGLPSGYYGNRVKFGQKSFARTDDKTSSEQSISDVKLSYVQTPIEKSSFQRTWELKSPDYRHDPMKRYDETGLGSTHAGNSLLLIKKGQNGERITKTFEEGKSREQDEKVDTERLAKLLSKDNDYLILKKTDANKYRKISEPDTALSQQEEVNASSQQNKKSALESQGKQWAKNKGVYARSSHKEDKKFAGLHGAAAKSNLKKTFEKFRDLADFFKDNEQESADNQYPSQEIKEGRDIVFSEDKLPDPIVISSDVNGKSDSLNQKPTNSIYSISTNFKHLDQQDRKEDAPKDGESNKNMLTAEVKSESQEFSWEPALKNAFPEAKSINAMSKNGNEIIVLDFNRNQLKNEHGYPPLAKSNSKSQNLGAGPAWMPGGRLLNSVGQRQVEVVLPSKLTLFNNNRRDEDKTIPILSLSRQDGPYSVSGGSEVQQVSIPFNQLSQFPLLFKALAEKKQTAVGPGTKSVTKKSAKWANQQNAPSENYNQFLKDFQELSEMDKKGKLAGKRSSEEVQLPASSFPELTTYGDVNLKQLGSLLQNILSNPNAGVEGGKRGMVENRNQGYLKAWYPAAYDVRRQGQWVSSESGKEHPQLMNDKAEILPGKAKEETVNEEPKEKKYEMELLEELTGESSEMRRLRREEAGKRKLRKTLEEALSLRGSRESKKEGECPAETKDKCVIKLGANGLDSKEEAVAERPSGRERAESNLREEEEEERKESVERSRSLKSDYESHLNELFENLSSEKNQKDLLNIPNESTPNRGKRKDTDKGKRSSRRDVKNKVSTTEVQNKILKNLPEDNYPSVYSPGIKRRLLSTGNEAEDADGYYGADEHERSEIAKGGEANSAKNDRNKCIDPMILELFGAEDASSEKNRDRRSLTAGLHSNFKREIDLDESMPNDFQNFLVTSLGGVGSQKREVVKKEEALWEGKESGQNIYNKIVDSSPGGKDAGEDSALEKREVSSGEKQKGQTYKGGSYFGAGTESDSTLTGTMSSAAHSQKIARSEDKSPVETKTSEYDDKVPTQIRIQITNAGEKEKKSPKTSVDENESSSTDVESPSKEKEFFDKNKMGQLGLNALPKLHQYSKPKFSLMDYDDCDSGDAGKQKPYAPRPYRRRRRKKKKYVPENPMKPIKDFIAFDQKAMEVLLRKYMADQNLAGQQHTTQKAPMSNHLPQVETVYNPTQGTNKAQLESSRITKINSISNKNSENAKNSLQSNDASAYDEGILRSYLKDKTNKAKSDKAYGKEFEDIDWKPYLGKFRPRTDIGGDSPVGLSFQNMKNFGGDVVSSLNHGASGPSSHIFNPYTQNPYYQKWMQSPYSNYFYHPPNMNVVNSNSFYDALKLKQELKSHGLNKGIMMKDHPSKTAQKPYYFNDNTFYGKVEDKDRSPNFPTTAEPTWNNYDFGFNKKPFAQKLKSRDFYNPGMKTQVDSRTKATYPSAGSKFIKNMDDEKLFDTTPSHSMDNSKDCDYLDVPDDEYPDDDAGKDIQFDEPIITEVIKKSNKLYDPANYHHLYSYKTSDVDSDGPTDSEDEFDDEYDETTDDDDLDDYSLLANSREAEPELSKNSHATATFQGTYRPEDSFSHLSTFYPRSSQFELKGNSFEQTEYNDPKSEEKFQQGRQTIPLVDLKNDMDPLSGSSNILKKANENTNIFGKNLMKNLNKYSYDESTVYPRFGRKLRKRKMDWQRKLKRSQEYPRIGSRLFYVAKAEMTDRDKSPSGSSIQSGNGRQNLRIPLVVQFAAPAGAEFEYDSEGKRKRVSGMSEEKTISDGNSGDLEVKDNLEDAGETISEDNVLESIIGKYVMRKRVQSSGLRKPEEAESGKRIRKRSVEAYRQKPRKLLRKRLSSGHLTENNFKKFHKKNFTGKRDIGGGDAATRHKLRRDEPRGRKARGLESQKQRKRSALDLFKKITNKDRDGKKLEDSESRSAGFEPLLLLSEKKPVGSAKEAGELAGSQVKKLASQDKEEPKLHRTSEPLNLKEGVGERKKEKSIVSVNPDGPWKLELNEKFKAKEEGPGREWSAGEGHREEENEDPNSYFGVRDSGRRVKRKYAGALPPIAGSFQTEVGTSYRPKSDASRPISKTHIWKRSLEPSMARTKSLRQDAGEASPSEPIAENPLTVEEHNRALHDTQSLSEGDSKPRAPHVLQRNSNKNGSFVTDDEPNARFPSKGKLTNLKSVFPLSSDANIIRDSRDINEGTSEFLGQQIVEAILSRVSTNPKFKELIAPGLTMRAPAHKEAIEEKRRALHQVDFNEQLQSFLQKFLFDLERLAEKHVKKRMCNQIDKQSKDFLQSLLNIPAGRKEKVLDNTETSCSAPEDVTESSPATALLTPRPLSSTPNQSEVSDKILTSLRKKQCLLRKLIDEYQSLSKLEQETLDVNYRYLMQELEQTNRELELPSREPYPVSGCDRCANDTCSKANYRTASRKSKKYGFESTKNFNVSENRPSPNCAADSSRFENQQSLSTVSPIAQHPITTSRYMPSYLFDPAEEQASSPEAPSQKSGNFENVDSDKDPEKTITLGSLITPKPLPVYCFEPQQDKVNDSSYVPKEQMPEFDKVVCASTTSQKNASTLKASISGFSDLVTLPMLSSPTPQTFDLLPRQNSTPMTDTAPPSLASESVRIKQSAPRDSSSENDEDHLSWAFQKPLYPAIDSIHEPSALHKLNTGDAAGLQLSLKSRGPWISTLDVAKSFKNVPNDFPTLPKGRVAGSDAPFAGGLKSVRAFIAPKDDLSNLSPPKATYYYRKPAFPYRLDKKFYALKERPFSKVMGVEDRRKQDNCQMLPFQYFLRKYPMTQRRPRVPMCMHGIRKVHFDSSFRMKKRRYHRRFTRELTAEEKAP